MCFNVWDDVWAGCITTKEITISVDGNTEMIDIGNYVDLVSGLYTVQLIYANLIDTECNFWRFHGEGLSGTGRLATMSDDGSPQPYLFSIEEFFTTISFENSVLNNGGDEYDPPYLINADPDNCEIDVELVLRVSGRFGDTDVGLQGDMNGDDALDVLDVVVMVEIILDGGMGDVGDLLNIVRG